MISNRTCENCLNAYNSPYSAAPLCVNKEWEAEVREIDTTVRRGETCGTFQRRKDEQPKLRFNEAVQLTFEF